MALLALMLSGCGPGTFGGTWAEILSPSGKETQAPSQAKTQAPRTDKNTGPETIRRVAGLSLAKLYGAPNRERGILPLALSNAYNGYSVTSCDLNGDKVDDVIVGAPESEGILPETTRSGWVYVVFGNASLPAKLDLKTQADAGFWGGKGSGVNRLGHSLVCADFNGDAIPDLALGAPHARSRPFNRMLSGSVYLIFGRPTLKGTLDVSKQADVVLTGAEEGDRAGSALAAGDVNGDGIADLIVGAPGGYGYQNQEPGAGETYVILGRPRFPRGIDLFKNWNSRIFGIDGSEFTLSFNQSPPDQSGFAVGSGDVNGDNLDDVIIGAPFSDGFLNQDAEAGEAYVIYGRKKLAKNLHLGRHADITFYGAQAGDRAGSVFQMGRLDKNSRALLIGSPGAVQKSSRKLRRGLWHAFKNQQEHPRTYHLKDAAYVYRGHSACGKPDPTKTNSLSHALGYSAALLDLNRDGRDNLVAGVPCSEGADGKKNSGAIVFFRDAFDKRFIAPSVVFQPEGGREDEYFGYALSRGDVNGNGKIDLLVGAPGLKRGGKGAHSGGVYILKDLADP